MCRTAWTTAVPHDKHGAMLRRLYDCMMRKAADDKAPRAARVMTIFFMLVSKMLCWSMGSSEVALIAVPMSHI